MNTLQQQQKDVKGPKARMELHANSQKTKAYMYTEI